MPAKDHYHDTVKHLLIKNGWEIPDEQVKIRMGRRRLWIDLHATKSEPKLAILVEVKGFENSPSSVEELAQALGQYMIYQVALSSMENSLPVILAVPDKAFNGIFSEPLGQAVIKRFDIRLMVFDPVRQEIVLWFP